LLSHRSRGELPGVLFAVLLVALSYCMPGGDGSERGARRIDMLQIVQQTGPIDCLKGVTLGAIVGWPDASAMASGEIEKTGAPDWIDDFYAARPFGSATPCRLV
jgi:hypothetical protein